MNGARAFVVAAAVACVVAAPGRALGVDRRLGAGNAKPALTGLPWDAAATASLAADIDGLLDGAPVLRGAHVGLLAIDTRSGAVVYARNADDAFVPASTLKLLTGSVALANLGPGYRFQTQALVDPASATLTVRAEGDPLLSVADLNALARSARSAGIAALPLGVQVDAGAFDAVPYPPGWVWDDVPYDYAAVVSAAVIEENVVHLSVAPGPARGAAVLVSGAPPPFEHFPPPPDGCPATPALAVRVKASTADTGSADALDLTRTGGCVDVIGELPLGSAPETLDAAVPDPIWYLRELTQYALAQAGIAVPSGGTGGGSGTAPAAARTVWSHAGEPLTDLLADMWWPSDNLIAEVLLKAVGRKQSGGPGTTASGIAAERAWLTTIGADPAKLTLADGSGLSTYDRITPRVLAAILQAGWNGPFRDVILDDLPLAGVRGTLRESLRSSLAAGRTFAKSGSMNHVRALAGYLATLHHGALTFAWTVDDWMGTDDDLDALRARVLSRFIAD